MINSGIITKTKSAVDKYSDEEIAEEIKLARLEYQTAKFSGTNKTELEYMQESLEKIYGNGNVTITEEDEVYNIEMILSNGSKKNYLYEDGNVKIKENYSEMSIGDYVNYPVNYENLNSYNGQYKPKEEYSGWRILSINKQNNEIKLVSAGIPLTYNFGYGNASEKIEELTSDFFDESTQYTNYGFSSLLTNNSEMKLLFSNKFTKQKNGTPSVSALTLSDIEKINGDQNWGYFYNNDLFSIPCNEINNGEYSTYWLATAYYGSQLWKINTEGKKVNGNNVTIGIRPVVTLEKNIKFTKNTSLSTDNKIVWNIE